MEGMGTHALLDQARRAHAMPRTRTGRPMESAT
jgi:hypothetical protein